MKSFHAYPVYVISYQDGVCACSDQILIDVALKERSREGRGRSGPSVGEERTTGMVPVSFQEKSS